MKESIAAKLALWQEKVEDAQLADQLSRLVESGVESDIEDAFFQELAFGTAGLRGVLGPGTNRMNIYTVGRATQGLADYLNASVTGRKPKVAITRDSRINGELFVKTAASILAANGCEVVVYPRVEPTPLLSFTVRYLECDAGINVTASHNPSPYNGYKVYGSDGCQIASEAADQISEAIALVDPFETVKTCDFTEALDKGDISWVADEVIDQFIDAVVKAGVKDPASNDVALKLVYTPLCGAGFETMDKLFTRIGVCDVTTVSSQVEPNGEFPTCPYPNPEFREALEEGIAVCEQVDPDLLLASDPDADRVGIAVKDNGSYALLSGNEVGILMLDYLCKMRTQLNTMPEGALAVSTIVSTMMIDAIAADWGVEIVRTLTGFKYIGGCISDLESRSEEERFLLGFEESYGYLIGTHARDKDAIAASMIICQMAQHYKAQGMNLAQAMNSLYEQYGFYRNKTLNFSYPGAEGAARMADIMSNLRNNPPAQIAGFDVENVVDYRQGTNGLPKANVLQFDLPHTNKVIFRPSGTEPKIKAYLFGRGETDAAAYELLASLESQVNDIMGA